MKNVKLHQLKPTGLSYHSLNLEKLIAGLKEFNEKHVLGGWSTKVYTDEDGAVFVDVSLGATRSDNEKLKEILVPGSTIDPEVEKLNNQIKELEAKAAEMINKAKEMKAVIEAKIK